jgi:hypothetical protein
MIIHRLRTDREHCFRYSNRKGKFTFFRVLLMVLNDMLEWGVEEYERPWARNAGIGDGKRFRSINLTFYEISKKGVRCENFWNPIFLLRIRPTVNIGVLKCVASTLADVKGLFQMLVNSIRKTWERSTWLMAFKWRPTVPEPTNPSLCLRRWVNVLFKNQNELSVHHFASQAFQEEKGDDHLLFDAVHLIP